MTDRVKGFVVTLEYDLRVDDAQGIHDAIRRIRGVGRVQKNLSKGIDDIINRNQIRIELEERLWKALRNGEQDSP